MSAMKHPASKKDPVGSWLISQGLAGRREDEILTGFCDRLREDGLPLARGLALVDTLHPVFEGRAFVWRADGSQQRSVIEYGSTATGEAAASWEATAYFHLVSTGGREIRHCFRAGVAPNFGGMAILVAEGQTDCLTMIERFDGEDRIGPMDALYSQWTTDHDGGFEEDHLERLRRLVPVLALAIKSASLARIAATLAEVYLGRDAGRRVLKGQVQRGVADEIGAVLWFSDLRHFTLMADTSQPEEILPFLNDYAEAVITSVEEHGGEVLKLIGDGVLAIFRAEDRAEACRGALRAEAALRDRLVGLSARRIAEGRPVTSVYLGLHVGRVFYGNIGSDTRLDFTVVGPAVNEVSRIAALCSSVERDIVVSPTVIQALRPEERSRFVSLGRFALRGVARPQELFTLDRSEEPPAGQM